MRTGRRSGPPQLSPAASGSEVICATLRQLGIDYLQGFSIHRPVPLSEPIILLTDKAV